jgi:hypothetical protein
MLSNIHTPLSQGGLRGLKLLVYHAEISPMAVGTAIASNQL